MTNHKPGLLAEIAAKMKRKETLKKEIEERRANIEQFVTQMLHDMDELIADTQNQSLLIHIIPLYAKSFEGRVKAIDPGAYVDVKWAAGDVGDVPRLEGILIKWSKEYQAEVGCDEQLYVDVASLLFR